jgi:hypothetical protein
MTALRLGNPSITAFKEMIMKKLSVALLATIGCLAVGCLVVAPAVALNSQSGMPREPKTFRGKCAKASEGNHIPYRGWRTRNRLAFNKCLRGIS